MTNRLVWNFEINPAPMLDLQALPTDSTTTTRWEARYFWPHDRIITLHGLTTDALDLSHYKIKQRQDRYYLLPHHSYNIKERRQELFYKPLIEQTASCQAFGKKINLTTSPADEPVPGTNLDVTSLLALLKQPDSKTIAVAKTALIYKFRCTPTIKLELARVVIGDHSYFSACIEGRSHQLVTLISNHVLPHQTCCDYINFLHVH